MKYFKDDNLISTEYYEDSRNGIAHLSTKQTTHYLDLKIYGEKNEYFDKMLEDFRNISLPERVSGDINIPLIGKNGSTISWVSDKPEIISSNGKYTQPFSGDTAVNLTAVFTYKGMSITKSFTVMAEYKKPENVVLLQNVDTADVTLLDEYLLNAEQKDIDFLLELEPEKFLYNWYITSGSTPKINEGYNNSWESTTNINFRGHMFGHYMTALSQAYNGVKDENIKEQLLEKIKSSVNGFIECQNDYAKKYPERAGYAAPFSEY